MNIKTIIILLLVLILLSVSNCGCFEQSEYDVTINVLYYRPEHINNTTIYLDGEILMQFENFTLETYPPFLGDKTVRLDRGKHELFVVDNNYYLNRTKSINVQDRIYVDIIISYDKIDISHSTKQTGYK